MPTALSLRFKLGIGAAVLIAMAIAVVGQQEYDQYRFGKMPHHWYLIVFKVGFGRGALMDGPFFWGGPYPTVRSCEQDSRVIGPRTPFAGFRFVCKEMVDQDAARMQPL